ncbi:MAG TPA: UTP--glucose-1-phosphate uridylyltransferase [Candidatus Dormibacteraeota bacterium]|nr:UTP--glucose-1-phosphate uridylyltransferase [Candidatus Dormibacteraeota bacterium]
MKIRKAVIAAAGMGTRFLPQTKAMPKEMLPLVDKPIIQYIVEELVDAGIEDIVIVTGYNKRSIEDHFAEPNSDLIKALSQDKQKHYLLDELNNISNIANFIYIRQKNFLGNAAPLINSEHIINNEPFIFTFGDDFIKAEPSRFKQMIQIYEQHQANILSCIEINNDEDYLRYGVISGQNIDDNLVKMDSIIEKPGKADAKSNIASVSSYIFNPEIFKYLSIASKGIDNGQEISLQKAIRLMIDDGHETLAYKVINGKYHDSGNKLEYIKTVFDFGVNDPDIGQDLRNYLLEQLG